VLLCAPAGSQENECPGRTRSKHDHGFYTIARRQSCDRRRAEHRHHEAAFNTIRIRKAAIGISSATALKEDLSLSRHDAARDRLDLENEGDDRDPRISRITRYPAGCCHSPEHIAGASTSTQDVGDLFDRRTHGASSRWERVAREIDGVSYGLGRAAVRHERKPTFGAWAPIRVRVWAGREGPYEYGKGVEFTTETSERLSQRGIAYRLNDRSTRQSILVEIHPFFDGLPTRWPSHPRLCVSHLAMTGTRMDWISLGSRGATSGSDYFLS